jgi:TolA-binding protein
MTPHAPSPTPDELIASLVEAAQAATEGDLSAREQAGVYRLERALLRNAPARRSVPRVVWLLPVALATVLGVFAFKRVRQADAKLGEHAITFEAVSARVSDGGYVSSDSAQAAVKFSDQSDLGLARGTRMRISRLEPRGARVMLEGGSLHARIHPQPRANWTLDAGPYVVHVTGTEFELAWRADEQTLDLRLLKGSVVVEGPLAVGGVKVDAGQHLVADTKAGSLSLVDELNTGLRSTEALLTSAPSSRSPAATGATQSAIGRAASGSNARSGAGSARAEEGSWAARVAHGDFDRVIEDAESRGVDKALAESNPVDLAALADAARYGRRHDIAKRALSAERMRYPDSIQARDAAFFLGGLAEAQNNDAAAVDWYEVYLRESPNGAYASQALGRKMVLAQHLHDVDGARADAAAYLARFPDGPYAPSARKLLQSR